MQTYIEIGKEFQEVSKKFFISLAGFFVAASTILALNGFNGSSAAVIDNTPDDDTVAIIRGGAFSESELRTDAAQGDVPKVFSAFGISQSELNGFVNGVVYRDGRVTVGDKLVATGATTAGRWNNPTSDMTRIAGTERAYKMSTSHFTDEGQTAFVKMVNGQFSFAVIKSCGNPVTAKPTPKPPAPAYACTSLRASRVGTTNTFRFATTASATGGAQITNYRYDYGDGTVVTTPAPGPSHTYTKPGTYTARVTVLVSVNGQTVERTDNKCTVRITIAQPPTPPKPPTENPTYACNDLNAELIAGQEHSYKYTLAYTAENGATLNSVDFDFGTGQTPLNDVKPEDLDNVTHTYANPGSYTTTATLSFNVNDVVQERKCSVRVSVPKPEECRPGIPVGDDRCDVLGDTTPPVETPPAELPSTGPAEWAVGGLGVSSLAGAGYYWQASRRKLINRMMNR